MPRVVKVLDAKSNTARILVFSFLSFPKVNLGSFFFFFFFSSFSLVCILKDPDDEKPADVTLRVVTAAAAAPRFGGR